MHGWKYPLGFQHHVAETYLERYQPKCEHNWQIEIETAYGPILRCSKCAILKNPPKSMADVEQQSEYEPNWRSLNV